MPRRQTWRRSRAGPPICSSTTRHGRPPSCAASTRDGVSDVQLLATLLASYDRWWPRAALAAQAPPRPSRTLPVLAFASTGLGPEWVKRVHDSAEAWGGASAVVRDLPGYGHLDVLVGRRAAQDVFEPARAWLAGAR